MRNSITIRSARWHQSGRWRQLARLCRWDRLYLRPSKGTVLAAGALLLVVATMAVGIVVSQHKSRANILSNIGLRDVSSATFVSTFVSQQAERERSAASEFLSARRVSPERFKLLVAAFDSPAAVLLDAAGRLLAVAPADHALLGEPIAARYAHLTAAERGLVDVSNVVPSAARRLPVVAIAVPFSTRVGRRVFSAAYPVSSSTLAAFVQHTIAFREHEVFVVDASGRLVAASPRTTAPTLGAVDPALARAVAHAALRAVAGAHAPTLFTVAAVPGARVPTTFALAPVPGTSWRLVIAVPDSELFASIGGWTAAIPWLVFGIVTVLGVALVVVFARFAALSRLTAQMARTDSLTGLANRRAIEEHLTRATARARRTGQPLAVVMIDLDTFKQINDRHGHGAGDRVLCAVADCMRQVLRAEEPCGRWGGDEFVVLLPEADAAQAQAVVERLQCSAARLELADIGLVDGVPLSIGAASAVFATPEEAIHAADLALYQRKGNRQERRASRREPAATH